MDPCPLAIEVKRCPQRQLQQQEPTIQPAIEGIPFHVSCEAVNLPQGWNLMQHPFAVGPPQAPGGVMVVVGLVGEEMMVAVQAHPFDRSALAGQRSHQHQGSLQPAGRLEGAMGHQPVQAKSDPQNGGPVQNRQDDHPLKAPEARQQGRHGSPMQGHHEGGAAEFPFALSRGKGQAHHRHSLPQGSGTPFSDSRIRPGHGSVAGAVQPWLALWGIGLGQTINSPVGCARRGAGLCGLVRGFAGGRCRSRDCISHAWPSEQPAQCRQNPCASRLHTAPPALTWAREKVAAALGRIAPMAAARTAAVRPVLERVLDAFAKERLGTQHFASVSGYGHGDQGREVLDRVFARVLQAEAAAVRLQFTSGTHAITAALFGVLRPGDRLLALTGRPYDTLEEVIGLRGAAMGSLADFGVTYAELPLNPQGRVDEDGSGAGAGAAHPDGAAAAKPRLQLAAVPACGRDRPDLPAGEGPASRLRLLC